MCLNPVRTQQQSVISKRTGLEEKFGTPKPNSEGNLLLPCGKCSECISKRAIEWAYRAKHEISLHKQNCFITLTYNDENLPPMKVEEIKYGFQCFMKRLRKKIKKPVRYMVSHEFGTLNYRPHHHAIIFGWEPSNQIKYKRTKGGSIIFRSKELEDLWSVGHSSVGTANERTAYYIASYSLKGKHHNYTDPKTGESIRLSDCMDASKRPAIGYEYFAKNMEQLINADEPLPRYYLKRLLIENPQLHLHYENLMSLQLKTRSASEIFAKYIITEQKKNSTEFRSTHENSQEYEHMRIQLQTNKDSYHESTKQKEKK